MAPRTITLNNGYEMPFIGLGTWRSPASVMMSVVKDSIDMGYRHFDCAYIYTNETEIGLALEDRIASGAVRRDQLFITSKLWNTFHSPQRVREGFEISLQNLRLKYLDLYLIHWPMGYKEDDEPYPKDDNGRIIYSDVDYLDTWNAMETLVEERLCRSIGLSNFNIRQIDQILKHCNIKPQVLQAECHPYLPQHELVEFCRSHNIAFTAYSPLGSAHTPYSKPGDYPLLENPIIRNIAENHNANAAQILLAYQVKRGNAVVPRSIDKLHLKSNLVAEGIELTEVDMDTIKRLDMGEAGRILRMDVCRDHPFYPFGEDEIDESSITEDSGQ